MLFVCHSVCIIIFTQCRKILLDNINIFYYIIGVNLKREVTKMKPAVSALNDWLKTIIVHKSFNNLRIIKNKADFATIELCSAQQYNNVTNHYEFTTVASINIAVDVVDGKLKNVVFFRMSMPTGFVETSAGDEIKYRRFTNISLKNLIEFVDLFFKMYRKNDFGCLSHLYNIPNHNNMGFHSNYKPFKDGFNSYFKKHKKEYDMFIEQREILFSYLDKNSKINGKKKDVNKDFVKG